jgi:uncharacterized membrane protein YsdA (DUF1294 family)
MDITRILEQISLEQIGWFYLIANVAALAGYWADKAAAMLGVRRIRESVLLGLALGGGFIGSLAGMLAFRHKRRKPAFYLMIFAAAVLHATFWVWSWWTWLARG